MKSPLLQSKARRLWQEEIRPLAILAVILFSLRSSLADWNDVPTGSMKPTILEGDRIFVNKLAYDLKVPFTTFHLAEWSNPRRGEIVVFYSPHDGKRLVKRVVGLPGDIVELRNNVLKINGQTAEYVPINGELLSDLSEFDLATHSFATEKMPGQGHHSVATYPAVQARRDFEPYVVPSGAYFMMGDNRDDSFDSRYYGPVERSRILGRASAIVLSLDKQHYWKPRLGRSFRSLSE